MTTPLHDTKALMEKIRSLPTDQRVEVEDFVDFLRKKVMVRKTQEGQPLDFPVDDTGPWPNGLDLSRKDIYGDDGR